MEHAARHRVPGAEFEALAAGRGNAGTVHFLRAAEYARRLFLLRALLNAVQEAPDALGRLPAAEVARDALVLAQTRTPEEFTGLLTQPQTGVWLAHCLHRLSGGGTGEGPVWADVGHLHALAAVAALRAGLTLHTQVPLRGGDVMFPTLGMARFAEREAWSTADVAVEDGRLRVFTPTRTVVPPDDPEADGPGWLGLRRLDAEVRGRPVTVWLDDVNPYRGLSRPLPPGRIPEGEFAAWKGEFAEALGILDRTDPENAAALALGVRSLTPVAPARHGPTRSASSANAFGGVIAALPPDPLTLTATLVREFQHLKLAALQHLLTLHQSNDSELHYAPWRDVPRSLGRLLHGAYGSLGVTEFWARRRDTERDGGDSLPEWEFALHARQTAEAIRALEAAEHGLTPDGRRFVQGMAVRLRALREDGRATPRVYDLAEQIFVDHRTGWRLRHLAADPDDVRELARAWQAGEAAKPRPDEPVTVPDPGAAWSHARTGLVLQLLGAPVALWSRYPAATEGDISLVSGRPDQAVAAYSAELEAAPDDPDTWTGLILALTAVDPATRALLDHPALPRAVHHEIRAAGGTPTLTQLLSWLTAR